MASILALLNCVASAQQIQRCEDPSGKVTYSNDSCPAGSAPTRALQAAPSVTDAQREAAGKQLERDAATAATLNENRKERQAEADNARNQEQRDRCSYLQGEINASQRLRNTLTTRRYYSLDNLGAMDHRLGLLVEQYRSDCGAPAR